jgi:hypothetical protein
MLAHVEHARHVLAVNLHRRARLTQKARHRIFVLAQLRHEQLDGYALPQLLVHRRHHVAHTSGAEHLLHAILSRK